MSEFLELVLIIVFMSLFLLSLCSILNPYIYLTYLERKRGKEFIKVIISGIIYLLSFALGIVVLYFTMPYFQEIIQLENRDIEELILQNIIFFILSLVLFTPVFFFCLYNKKEQSIKTY